jgi:hypothetical protein
MTEMGEFGQAIAIGGTMVTLIVTVVRPIGVALARRIGGQAARDPATGLTTGEMHAERMAALEDRIAELENERGQLEERLDFAERMLAQGRSGEPQAIAPPGR